MLPQLRISTFNDALYLPCGAADVGSYGFVKLIQIG